MIDDEKWKWAIAEALREWEGGKGEAHEWVPKASADNSVDLRKYEAFLVKWKISRTIRREGKLPLFREFIRARRAKWLNAMPGDRGAYESVKSFASLAKQSEWSTPGTLPTSMASKTAFITNPAVFAPYDSYGRKALRSLGFDVPDHDYQSYMHAFVRAMEHFQPRLAKDALALSKKSRRQFAPEIAAARITDKYLMALGGF